MLGLSLYIYQQLESSKLNLSTLVLIPQTQFVACYPALNYLRGFCYNLRRASDYFCHSRALGGKRCNLSTTGWCCLAHPLNLENVQYGSPVSTVSQILTIWSIASLYSYKSQLSHASLLKLHCMDSLINL